MPPDNYQQNQLQQKQRQRTINYIWLWILAIIVFSILYFNTGNPRLELGAVRVHQAETSVMRTYARLLFVVEPDLKAQPDKIVEAVWTAVRKVETLMNAHSPDSDLAKIKAAPVGTGVSVDPMTWEVLQQSRRFYYLTDGVFDPTILPIMKLYNFNNPDADLPTDEQIQTTLNHVGLDKVKFARRDYLVTFTVPDMGLDLAAIAKGYAVDCAYQVLKEFNVNNAMVEIGGEIRVWGNTIDSDSGSKDQRRPWQTGIYHPREGRISRVLSVTDKAIATSGDYEKFRVDAAGKRLSHTIDPRIGRPNESNVASVTVVHPNSCLEADALATIFSVVGADEKILALFPTIDVLFQIYDAETKQTNEVIFNRSQPPVFQEKEDTGLVQE